MDCCRHEGNPLVPCFHCLLSKPTSGVFFTRCHLDRMYRSSPQPPTSWASWAPTRAVARWPPRSCTRGSLRWPGLSTFCWTLSIRLTHFLYDTHVANPECLAPPSVTCLLTKAPTLRLCLFYCKHIYCASAFELCPIVEAGGGKSFKWI